MTNVLRLPLALLVCGLISACGLMGGNGGAALTPVAQAAPAREVVDVHVEREAVL